MSLADTVKSIVRQMLMNVGLMKVKNIRSIGRNPMRIEHDSGGYIQFNPDGTIDINGYISTSDGGVTDHGDLTGLSDDDHTQYLLTDGSRTMTGSLDMGGFDILNIGTADIASIGTNYIETSTSYLNISGDTSSGFTLSPSGNCQFQYDSSTLRMYVPTGGKYKWFIDDIIGMSLDEDNLNLNNNTNIRMYGGDIFMNGNVIDQAHLWGTTSIEFMIDLNNETSSTTSSLLFNQDGNRSNMGALVWDKTLQAFGLLQGSSTYTDLYLGGLAVHSGIDMQGNTISDLATPTSDYDAATKKYVDDNIGASSTGTNSVTFTIDEDNTDAGVNTALKFNRGSSGDDARLMWSETDGKFYLDDSTTTVPLSVSRVETIDGISFDGSTKAYTIRENDDTGNLEITVPSGEYIVFKRV